MNQNILKYKRDSMVGKNWPNDHITSAEDKDVSGTRKSIELNYEQNLALDHVIKFVKTDANCNKLLKKWKKSLKKPGS